MATHHPTDLVRLVDGHRAQDHPRRPSFEELVHVGLGTHPPAHFDRHGDGRGDGQDQGPVDRSPGAGGVEIDHVQPRGTGGGEAPGQSDRVAVLALSAEVALGEPHRLTVSDVDGRVEVHHTVVLSTARTKLSRMASPTAPDFSGWNWVPQTAPHSAAAVRAPP